MCSSESSDQPEETAAPDPPPPAPVTHIQDRDPVPEEQVLCVCVLLSMREILASVLLLVLRQASLLMLILMGCLYRSMTCSLYL